MRKCCVPFCKSSYSSNKLNPLSKVSFFKLPKDDELRKVWEANIRRKKPLGRSHSVCSIHFTEDSIVRFDEFRMPDGSVYKSEKTPKLKPNAIPTLFPGYAPYINRRSRRLASKNNVASPGENKIRAYDPMNRMVTSLPIKEDASHVCFVPFCKTNDALTEIVRNQGGFTTPHMFTTPQDSGLLKQWEAAIGRSDARLSKTSHVCCLHFLRSDYIQCVSDLTSGDPNSQAESAWGVVPALNVDAVPSIFPILRVSNFGEVDVDKLPPHDVRKTGLVHRDYIFKNYGCRGLFENINKSRSSYSVTSSLSTYRSQYGESGKDRSKPDEQVESRVGCEKSRDGVGEPRDGGSGVSARSSGQSNSPSCYKYEPLKASILQKTLEGDRGCDVKTRVPRDTNGTVDSMQYSEDLHIIQVNPNCTCEQDKEPLVNTVPVEFERLESTVRRIECSNWIHSFTHDKSHFVLVHLEDLDNFVTRKKIVIDTRLNVKVLVGEKQVVNIEGLESLSLVGSLRKLLKTVEDMGVCSSLHSPLPSSEGCKFKCTGYLPYGKRSKSTVCPPCKENAKRKSPEQALRDLRDRYSEAARQNKNLRSKLETLRRSHLRSLQKIRNNEIDKIDEFMEKLEQSMLSSDEDRPNKKKRKWKSEKKKEERVSGGVVAFSPGSASVGERQRGNIETIFDMGVDESSQSVGEDGPSVGLKRKAGGVCNRLGDTSLAEDDSSLAEGDSSLAEGDTSLADSSGGRGSKRKKLDCLDRLGRGARVLHEPVESYTNMKQMTVDDSDGMLVLMIDPDIITEDSTA